MSKSPRVLSHLPDGEDLSHLPDARDAEQAFLDGDEKVGPEPLLGVPDQRPRRRDLSPVNPEEVPTGSIDDDLANIKNQVEGANLAWLDGNYEAAREKCQIILHISGQVERKLSHLLEWVGEGTGKEGQ